MKLHLSPNLSFCDVEGQLIFLDRTMDRYFTLSGGMSAAFRRLLERGEGLTCVSDVEQLWEAGLIAERGSALGPCQHQAVRRSFDRSKRCASPLLVLDAGLRLTATIAMLRLRGLGPVLDGLSRKRQPWQGPGAVALEKSADAVAAFRDLGLFLPLTDRCLPVSLALSSHLAGRSVRTDLVIGVSVNPFRAHAWVQWQDVVLNDSLDQVGGFTPILVV